jgi:hypothetical protein
MSFGQLMRHIAAVNLKACANASGMTRLAELKGFERFFERLRGSPLKLYI